MLTDPTDQLFTRSRTVVSRVVGGETLIVPVRGKVGDLGSIYSFNGTGSLIWQLLDAPQTLEQLSGAVTLHYAVEHDSAQKDVAHFIGEMLAVGLVEVCAPAAITASESQTQAQWLTAGPH